MDVGDAVFGIGNWVVIKYLMRTIVEGIVVPRCDGIKDRRLDTLARSLNNSYYQGIFQYHGYVIINI